MTIDREIINQAVEATTDTGFEIRINERYSGRGMYDRTCFGVVTNTAGFARFIIETSRLNDEVADDLIDRLLTDSMALKTIYYFPGVTLGDATDADSCRGCDK